VTYADIVQCCEAILFQLSEIYAESQIQRAILSFAPLRFLANL